MENKNEIKNLNENEVNEISGGYSPFNQEKGHWTKSFCRECHKEFEDYVIPCRDEGYCLPICLKCRLKDRLKELKKNQ